ncbi:MAG TPA: sigma-70 family RNA polymerase sigma factor [Actinopolymorphaceae bacterium]
MDDDAWLWLAEQFESHRNRLRAVAHRMLGSFAEADDAVQEAWLRIRHSDPSGVENVGGWLTTIVARVALDMLRSRKARREEPLDAHELDGMSNGHGLDPQQEAELADSVGLALLVVLDRLAPAERVAFVLHNLFAVPFDEIAPIVGRSPAATRQLASRARRRIQGSPAVPHQDLARQREVVDAFLSAARAGDLNGLVAVFDPDVVLHADHPAAPTGTRTEIRGAQRVAERALVFSDMARYAQQALVNGAVGLVVAPRGRLLRALCFTITHQKIAAIEIVTDPVRLDQLELGVLATP